jgi:hypothetical protein
VSAARNHSSPHFVFAATASRHLRAKNQLYLEPYEFRITQALDLFGELRSIGRLHAILGSPGTKIAKRLEYVAPRRFTHDQLSTLPSTPQGFELPQRFDVRHQQIGDRFFVRIVGCHFFFIDKLKAGHTLDGGCEGVNGATHFKNEETFRRERRGIGAQL